MQSIYKNKNKIMILFIILLFIPFILNIGLDIDEPFTIGLVRHNYLNIINLTKLDVHPPLYYLVLKLFLQITTFWTSNIFIKIIFSRILSVIFGIISFLYLLKITSLINIKVNKYLCVLIYIALPLGLGKYDQLTNIRMYEFSIMLMCIEIFYLLKLNQKLDIKNCIPIMLSIVFNLYTNYFSGLIAGIYLINFLVLYFFKKDWKKLLSCFAIGSISIILFIPWIPYIFKQSSAQSILINHFNIKFILEILIPIILMEIVANKYYSHNSNLRLMIHTVSITSILALTFVSILTMPILRYLCSIIYPAICIFTVMIYDTCKNNLNKKKKIIIFVITLILIFSYAFSSYSIIYNFDIPSISFTKKLNKINKKKKTGVNIKHMGLESYRWNASGKGHGGGGGNSIYLLSIHKKITDHNYISTYQVIGNGNKKLFKAVFPNIEHYSTKKPN